MDKVEYQVEVWMFNHESCMGDWYCDECRKKTEAVAVLDDGRWLCEVCFKKTNQQD